MAPVYLPGISLALHKHHRNSVEDMHHQIVCYALPTGDRSLSLKAQERKLAP